MELKPCPSCGRIEPLFETRERERDMYGDHVYRVRCTDLACVCSGTRWYHNEAGALREWNRRPNNWIPVSEQRPEIREWVLITTSKKRFHEVLIARTVWGWNVPWEWEVYGSSSLDFDDVIAWMPLPEPYTESELS